MSFDQYGNVVGNIYIRKVEKKGGRLVNTVIKTYPNVSQFWTYDPAAFHARSRSTSRDMAPPATATSVREAGVTRCSSGSSRR